MTQSKNWKDITLLNQLLSSFSVPSPLSLQSAHTFFSPLLSHIDKELDSQGNCV